MTGIRTRMERPRAVDVPFAKQAGNPETDVQRAIERVLGFAAPKTAEYLVGASDATLTAERVVTDTATIAWDLLTASQAKASVVDASITYAKIQNVAALSVVGRAGNTSGVSAAISAGSDDQVLRRSGTSIAFGALNLAGANAVTGDLPFANITQLAGLSVAGVTGNVTADIAAITAGSDFQVLRRSGTALAFGAVDLSQGAAVTGDLAFSNLAQIAGLSVLGVTGAGTADVAAITAGSDFQVLRRSGSAVSFGAVDLSQANAITGDLPFSALTQGSARSVLGVTGNATADFASIQGATDTVLRVNSAGNALAFGAIDVSKSAAVTGLLQAASVPVLTGAVAAAGGTASTTATVDLVTVIGDNTNTITTGVKGYFPIDFACTITGWTLVADASGSIVIDVWKDTYANFPPTVADTIAGSEKPTLSSVQKNQDLSLSTWTTSVSAGDVIGFNVDSATTVKQVTLTLKVTKTS